MLRTTTSSTVSSIVPLILLIIHSLSPIIPLSSAMSLSGSKALVTGGGRGIGRAIAQILAEEGAQVAICSRTKAELEETAAYCTTKASSTNNKDDKILHKMEMFEVDLKDKQQVEKMVSSLKQKWGGIDILINNAGKGSTKGAIHSLDAEDLADVLSVNVVSVHRVTSSVLRNGLMKHSSDSNELLECKKKTIVNISSRAGKIGIPNMGFYVASKFALEGYSATLAEELKDGNITVNTISPGMVNTESFPKAERRKGVRSAASVKDGLLVLINTDKTGHYLHVDELDMVREKGLDDSLALKSINEEVFKI